jgi:hypothetical protein
MLLLNTKPVLMKRLGSSKIDYKESIIHVFIVFPVDTIVCPGHGESFLLKEAISFYEDYLGTNFSLLR